VRCALNRGVRFQMRVTSPLQSLMGRVRRSAGRSRLCCVADRGPRRARSRRWLPTSSARVSLRGSASRPTLRWRHSRGV